MTKHEAAIVDKAIILDLFFAVSSLGGRLE
jgi:hypothetical protein